MLRHCGFEFRQPIALGSHSVAQHEPQDKMRLGKLRLKVQSLSQSVFSSLGIAPPAQCNAQIILRGGRIRLDRHGDFELGGCAARLLAIQIVLP